MSTISKINGIAIGGIAKINGIPKADISKVDGVLISAPAWVTPTAIHSKCGEDACCPASNTIDGSEATYWTHITEHEHWIIFDLGVTKNVKRVKLYCYGGDGYSICTVSAVYINDSADESGGSKGSLGTIYVGNAWNEIDVTDTNGQYIKIKLMTLDINGANCAAVHSLSSFFEFQAYV